MSYRCLNCGYESDFIEECCGCEMDEVEDVEKIDMEWGDTEY